MALLDEVGLDAAAAGQRGGFPFTLFPYSDGQPGCEAALSHAQWQRLGDVLQRLGQELVVAAVRPVDLVAGAQGQHRTDGAAFLAHGRVRGAVHQAFGGQVQHGLFKEIGRASWWGRG
ncbi:hypothetical protein G6F62_013834 [Rhizopus arrhizus]|nr:hypothetical protein G6F62_013834 [Rhizopus arrhizus]